ncbi:dihydrodipicolinate synthase family protein [Cellulomonas hominis]|uniref:dihydrodipicolinate synthase family protein n=1 Tax=Cellulomonas hominis TaxID=156981 RepID=UPI001C11115F|nr:dihydrodipicolinate synthase family protein [Cellulomonas hominis]MBU5422061.1 dihydrodipicolinate synthase family protein [Cellulomonas hominis]
MDRVVTGGADLDRVFSALVTPTRADDSIDLDVLAEIVEEQLARGVEGFYLCGSSGEALLLSLAERREIVERVTDQVAGRVPVVAHVGTVSTAQTIELARAAAGAGVQAVSMIPPYYYAFTSAEIERYYLDVIEAVAVPVLLYNIPQFTRVAFTKGNAAGLLGHDQVVGMKHTDHDLYSLERLVTAFPEKVFINGFDEQYLPALVAGARATIGTTVNIQPELFLRVRERFARGDVEGARRTQRQINHVVEVLVAHGVFQSTKYLAAARGAVTGNCRRPFRPLDDANRVALDRLAERIRRYVADERA